MSTTKTITASTVAVIALAAIPLFIQANKIEAARSELAKLEEIASVPDRPASAARRPSDARTSSRGDVVSLSGPKDIQSVFVKLLQARGTGKEMMLILASLGEIDEARFSEMLAEVENFPGDKDARNALMDILAELAPPGAAQEEVFKMMLGNRGVMFRNEILTRCVENDPESAIRWFHEMDENGEFIGTAVRDGTYKETLSSLLEGMLRTNPARAVAFFSELKTPPDGGWDHALQTLARGLGGQLAGGKSTAEFEKLLASIDKTLLPAIVQGAAATAVPEADLEGYVRFIDTYLSGPQRDEALLSHIASGSISDSVPLDKQLADAKQFLPGMLEEDVISRLVVGGVRENLNRTSDWVEDLPVGPSRDAGLQAFAQAGASRGFYQRAFWSAQNIGDPSMRNAAVASVVASWLQNDESTARAKLPADVLRNLPNQSAPESR